MKTNLTRRLVTAFAVLSLSLMGPTFAAAQSKPTIKIGGKNFTEQLLLSRITALYLKENGYTVTETTGMSSPVVRQALETGQIDLYWEYTGTALVAFLKKQRIADSDEAYNTVKQLDAEKGISWLKPSKINNTYALLMRKADSERLKIKSISDLAGVVDKGTDNLIFATSAEFYARPDGLPAVRKAYDLNFPADNIVKMDSGLLYSALHDGKVGVAVGFTTDGRIPALNLVVLDENKKALPAYNAAPVLRSEIATKDQALVSLLDALSDKLNSGVMSKLNSSVDVDKKDLSDVARDWLQTAGLIQK